ncbi:MAG: hypothetical protein JWL94_782 [Microbacteriaceae bacterium]|jgi:hydroxymethylpyrimidine pyrophosphatase-like HAD family hydrolase|nr:hypothetical protein [Microbacteriaceae bacterium]
MPPLGLLLDVDGPIASPITRSIAIDTITRDIVTLANAGVPVVFNTGRSAPFVRDAIVKPLLTAGLAPGARVFAVCEKGAVWFGATMNNFSGVQVERSLALPPVIVEDLRALLEDRYTDFVYWDPDKHAMVSFEQRTDVASDVFLEARDRLASDAVDLVASHGIDVVLEARGSGSATTVRVEPTIISVDIESAALGKDLGASRALDLLAPSGELPRVWRTVGDSRSDYAMADLLHERGFEVAHVDVRPADGVPDKPYEVITEGQLINDEAGAAFLSRCARALEIE